MGFTQLSILVIACLAGSTLSAPAQCWGSDGETLTECTHANSDSCDGAWNRGVGGDDTQIQSWSFGANNVNEWDQHKFSHQLNMNACAPTGMKSTYDDHKLIVAASWTSSGTCTAGRVTNAIHDAAGKRNVDCTLAEHPDTKGPTAASAGVKGALEAIGALVGRG